MVKGKPKAKKELHKMLSGEGYRLPHGYELRRCKTKKCGYKIRKGK